MKCDTVWPALLLVCGIAGAAPTPAPGPVPVPERAPPAMSPSPSAEGELTSYALVATNNRSLAPERPDLQYADDDGAQYAEFFAQLYGDERVTLLTSFDATSRATQGRWAARARPPTSAELLSAVRQLGVILRTDRSVGRRTQVLIVLAGHGDLERGAGFIELEDRRLMAAELERDIVEALPADRLHLIIDSCNSYFMLSPRKPGGKRWEVKVEAPRGLLERTASLGAVVSTSAEALTYEWSELQSGIFSYEVRSGLRGAADADGDGRVTYAELASFIQVANRRVPNDLYRPKVFARGPGGDGDEALVDLRSAAARRLTVASPSSRRLTVRSELGVRVADAHTEPGAAVTLLLPTQGTLYVAHTVAAAEGGGKRPSLRQASLAEGSYNATLDGLQGALPTLAQRGDLPVFRTLFDEPFGPKAFAALRDAVVTTRPEDLPQGVTRSDAERLLHHVSFAADSARSARLWFGGTSLGAGALLSAFSLSALIERRPIGSLEAMGMGAGLGLLAAGTGALLLTSEEEALAKRLATLDTSSERARAASVLLMERDFERAAAESRRKQNLISAIIIGEGAILTGVVTHSLLTNSARMTPEQRRGAFFNLAASVGFTLTGVLHSLFYESGTSRAWRFYLSGQRLAGSGDTAPSKGGARMTLEPQVSSALTGAPLFGLGGTF